ncbi:MAG: MFS transporter [Pseudomonadota bacterium]|nr:MFS transporter [Pseudomonadota bacterium]
MSTETLDTARGLHRGWLVTAGCFLFAIFSWGSVFYGHGFYIQQLTVLHGWSTSAVSGAVVLFWVVGIPMTFVAGSLIDRFGPRAVIAAGAMLVGISVIGIGHATELWQVWLAFVVMALGYPAVGVVGISSTLNPWFGRNLGVAMSFALTGASVGAMIVIPTVARLAEAHGFAFTATALGLSVIAVTLPIAAFVISAPPVAAGTVRPAVFGNVRPLIASRDFRIIGIGTGLSLMAQVGFLSHQFPVMAEHLAQTDAADAVAIAAFSSIFGRFGLGWLAARVDLRHLSAGAWLVQAIGLAAIAEAGGTDMIYAACALSGFVVGALVMLPPLLVRRWFGTAGYGRTYGLLAVALYLFQAMGPGLTGVAHDIAETYRPALWGQAAVLLLAIVVLMRLGAPPPAEGGR